MVVIELYLAGRGGKRQTVRNNPPPSMSPLAHTLSVTWLSYAVRARPQPYVGSRTVGSIGACSITSSAIGCATQLLLRAGCRDAPCWPSSIPEGGGCSLAEIRW